MPNHDKVESNCYVSISDDDLKLAIRHFTTYSGEWNWSLIENILPPNVIQSLEIILLHLYFKMMIPLFGMALQMGVFQQNQLI